MNIGVISSRSNSSRTSKSGICEDTGYVSECFEKALEAFGLAGKAVTVITGGGRGPETIVKSHAESKDYTCTVIPPRTKTRGSMAFPERNTSILSVSDALLVFWGGEDMYVVNVLSEAMFMSKPVIVFPI